MNLPKKEWDKLRGIRNESRRFRLRTMADTPESNPDEDLVLDHLDTHELAWVSKDIFNIALSAMEGGMENVWVPRPFSTEGLCIIDAVGKFPINFSWKLRGIDKLEVITWWGPYPGEMSRFIGRSTLDPMAAFVIQIGQKIEPTPIRLPRYSPITDQEITKQKGRIVWELDEESTDKLCDAELLLGNARRFCALQIVAQQEISTIGKQQLNSKRKRPTTLQEPLDVTVVTLRRSVPRVYENGHGGIEYSHRFLVRGHWRDQPYGPKRQLRRQQWIHDYVKGDPSKPLVIKDRVWDIIR